MTNKAVIVFSGGQDSTTCLIHALPLYDEIHCEWGKVFHFHPIGLASLFSNTHPLEITPSQLKQIFPTANDEDINIVLSEINDRLEEFKLNTRFRQRHFFSQIKGEVGASMKGVTESWEYSPEALKSFSSYYRAHPNEAEEDGYLKNSMGEIIRRANQREIGRKHFQRLNGNRASNPDDGYNLRGRGLIQITGHDKYHGYMRDYTKLWSGITPDTVNNPEIINEMPNAIRSALWFWLSYKIYGAERENGYLDVQSVTKRVNGGHTGLEERKAAYKDAEKALK